MILIQVLTGVGEPTPASVKKHTGHQYPKSSLVAMLGFLSGAAGAEGVALSQWQWQQEL